MSTDKVLLGHGSGGQMSHDLIDGLFARYFDNEILRQQSDSAVLECGPQHLAFTTDSFVVDPIFFPGGNIGKLAVAGTVNDLSVSGAVPKYLSVGFVIEEGFPMDDLEVIVKTMAEEASRAGVIIVTGDTKVVDKGKCDKIFINTSGIGILDKNLVHLGSGNNIRPGDKIIVNGEIGAHGMAIMAARNDLNISAPIRSDCACLNGLIRKVLDAGISVKFMRDATRGGLGTVAAELVRGKEFGLQIDEEKLVLGEGVRGMCELLGFDPLYVANEGKILTVVDAHDAEKTVSLMREHPLGREATVVGEIEDSHKGKAWMNTVVGGKRIIEMLSGQQLPRIC